MKMKEYEIEFTLEGGADIIAEDFDDACIKAEQEAIRQFGESIANEMFIKVTPVYE